MTRFDRLIKAAEIINGMAAEVPSHPLLEISAEAMAHRAAKNALLDKASDLMLLASEESSLPADDSA